jgi:hypothetical protein
MAAAESRLAKASSAQNRMTADERTRMELWLSMSRVYKNGKGKDMSNLRWINGAASKGLTSVSGDSKQAKQIGAHEALAHFMNAKLRSGNKMWTAEIAHSKWKNMKVSYKRVLKKFPMPDDAQWERDGKSKEDLASEVERVSDARRAAFQSYDVLWKELKDHPSFQPACQYASADFEDGDDDEADEDGDDNVAVSGAERTATDKDSESEDASDEDDEDMDASRNKSSRASSSSRGSPRKRSKKAKASSKPVKMSLKKTSEQPRHRDITAAYIAMKTEWNRMWLRTMMLKQRQDVYFMCLDRRYDRATTNQILMDVGLSRRTATSVTCRSK